MQAEYPILEFDASRTAIIEPQNVVKKVDVPEHCVICFFQDVITKVVQQHNGEVVARQRSEVGSHPLFRLELAGQPFALFHAGVGAPMVAALLEEVIARGCRKFIACGSAGVLDRQIAMGHVIVPEAAIRDEGTSYHYLPPGREVAAAPEAVSAIRSVLEEHAVPHLVSKTWTTDAIYRETRPKMQARRAEGCLVVEMEAAAFFAVARFRGVPFGQLLYGGDLLDGDAWDSRKWTKNASVREKLLWLAAEACLRL